MKNILKKVLVTIVFIVFFIGGSIGGFYLGSGRLPWEKKEVKVEKEKSKKEEVKEEELNIEDYKDLLKNIEEVYSYYYSHDYIKGMKYISKDKILFYAIMNSRAYDADTPITKEKVQEYVTKYFGENYEMEYKDYICPIDKQPLYKFEDNKYVFFNEGNVHGHGGGFYEITRNNYVKVLKATKLNDIIAISTHILYGTNCSDVCGPNTQYSITPGGEKVLGNDNYDVDYQINEEDYKGLKDQIPTTTFLFNKNSDGSYYLENVVIE